MKIVRLITAGLLGLLLAGAGMADATTTKCSGGTIAPGNYGSLVITGPCALPDSGVVNVSQSLTVTSTGALDGSKTSTLNVAGNVFVRDGGLFVLGCAEDLGCTGTSHDRIGQSLRATNALAVIVHGATIGGNVVLSGGGGGVNCDSRDALQGSPFYFAVEDTIIGQSVRISNVQSCWLGFIRNTVHGNVTIKSNTLADPDANEVVTNTISQSLSCTNNSPAAQIGDSAGDPNVVGGHKLGECAAL